MLRTKATRKGGFFNHMDIEKFIRDNYIQMTDREMSEHLPLSLSSINRVRARLGLKSPIRLIVHCNYTPLEKSAECYELWMSGITIIDVSKLVNLSPATVNRMIDRFLPVKTDNPELITKQSKINL